MQPKSKDSSFQPTNITDVVYLLDEYIDQMRSDKKTAQELIIFLPNYITNYFEESQISELELKKIAVELIDEIYAKITRLTSRDVHTDAYFAIVLKQLFFELAQRNILCFYILDNELRDDRFKLVTELIESCYFNVSFPYSVGQLDYTDEYTAWPTKEFHEVSTEIQETAFKKGHILYVEKDLSINHLSDILKLAEQMQNRYVCIFRNQSVDACNRATWLLGSFGDIIQL